MCAQPQYFFFFFWGGVDLPVCKLLHIYIHIYIYIYIYIYIHIYIYIYIHIYIYIYYFFHSFYFKFIYVNIRVWFVVLIFVSDEGVNPKTHVFCIVFYLLELHSTYFCFFYRASQPFTKLHCDIQFN